MKKGRMKDPSRFFATLKNDREIRLLYEEERAKTQIAMAVKAARARAQQSRPTRPHP